MTPIRYLNGLGLVASNSRKIKSGVEYDKYFTQPEKSDPFLSYNGLAEETIRFMADIIKKTLADTKKIAVVLKGTSQQQTLKNIFDFIFQHIQYKPDKPTEEELRRPVRSWHDRQTGVDCDCYSILIGSILSNLEIPFALRMVKINGKPNYQHVYVVVPKNGITENLNKKGGYYTIDPVLDTYNEEHPFTQKHDLFMTPIRYLNGLNGLHEHKALPNQLYYSPEAATEKRDALFFDGVDYYERQSGLNGLNGLNGLGFLKKIWGGIKTAGKLIKNISKKAIKPIVFKKDENGERTVKRKLFNLRNRQPAAQQPMQPAIQQPVQQPATSVSDTIDLVKNLNNDLGIEQVMELAKSASPDTNMLQSIISAEARANKGISPEEARQIAEDAAKAESFNIFKDVKQAGFGGGGMNIQTMLMGGLCLGMVYMAVKNKNMLVPAK